MKTFVLPLLASLASALGSAPAGAQKPGVAGAPSAAAVMRAAHGAAVVGGETWAAGPSYKARFRAGGVDVHVPLGPEAPRNLPLALELVTIERGGARVLAADGAVEPVLGDDGLVRFVHAGGVVERYEPRADGLEQSFVFPERPAGTGDLVVRARITSELAAQPGEHETLDFVSAFGGVRFGAVTGVDAAGATAPGAIRYDGTTIELVLPGAFVDRATYPLVLDPLIGSAFLVPGLPGYDQLDPDVAYDASNQVYLIAWSRRYSASDYDVHAQRISTAGTPVGSLLLLENDADTIALDPTVANVRASRRFLVAWEQEGATSYDVRGCAVHATDGAVSSTILIASGASDEQDPDACGEQTTADDEAFVVWTDADQGVYGTQVNVPFSGDPGAFGKVALMADTRAYRPSIATSFGTSGRAAVVYNFLYSTSDVDVYVTLIDRNGTVLDGPQVFAGGSPVENDPDVDGGGSEWIVAYTTNATGEDTEVHVRRMTWNGAALAYDSSTQLTADGVGQFVPAVAWTPWKAFVAWQESYDAGDTDVYVMALDPGDCGTCEPRTPLDLSLTWDGEPDLATQWSGGGGGDQILATWYSGTVAGLAVVDTVVKAQLLEAIGSGGSVQAVGAGCGAGGVLLTQGEVAAGSTSFAISLSSADPGATTGILILAQPGAPFACGGCSLLLPGSQFVVPLSGGGGTKSLPIPCNLGIVGASLQAQWAVLPAPSPCPLFGNVAASTRALITVGS